MSSHCWPGLIRSVLELTTDSDIMRLLRNPATQQPRGNRSVQESNTPLAVQTQGDAPRSRLRSGKLSQVSESKLSRRDEIVA